MSNGWIHPSPNRIYQPWYTLLKSLKFQAETNGNSVIPVRNSRFASPCHLWWSIEFLEANHAGSMLARSFHVFHEHFSEARTSFQPPRRMLHPKWETLRTWHPRMGRYTPDFTLSLRFIPISGSNVKLAMITTGTWFLVDVYPEKQSNDVIFFQVKSWVPVPGGCPTSGKHWTSLATGQPLWCMRYVIWGFTKIGVPLNHPF